MAPGLHPFRHVPLGGYYWFCVAVSSLFIRPRIDAATGLAAAVGGASRIYLRLLGFFDSSAIRPRSLAVLWGENLCHHPLAVRMKGRILLSLDGIKVPRSGLNMPAVKRLHRSASTNTKPEYITGHSLHSAALLMRSLNGVAAVHQYTHRMPRHLAERIWRKSESYHVFLQVAAFAQGIAQILASEMPAKVMALDSEYRRTVIPLPSEATVKKVMEKTCRICDGMTDCPRQCVNQIENALREADPEAAGRRAKGEVRYG
jgi:hypothetical protein